MGPWDRRISPGNPGALITILTLLGFFLQLKSFLVPCLHKLSTNCSWFLNLIYVVRKKTPELACGRSVTLVLRVQNLIFISWWPIFKMYLPVTTPFRINISKRPSFYTWLTYFKRPWWYEKLWYFSLLSSCWCSSHPNY